MHECRGICRRKYYEQALQICEEEGDQLGEAAAFNNLGRVYGALGQKEQERKYYEQALSISREVGDRKGEAATLNNLGRVLDEKRIGGLVDDAADFYDSIGARNHDAALVGIGVVLKAVVVIGQEFLTAGDIDSALVLLH